MQRPPATILAMFVFAFASAAACDDEPTPPAEGLPCEDCRHPHSIATFIQNRTGGPVEVVVNEPDSLTVDQHVLDARLELPIPPAVFGAERRRTLDPAPAQLRLNALIMVVDGEQRVMRTGGIVRVDGGRPFLVVGTGGDVEIRRDHSGEITLEADHPKLTMIVPTERTVAECRAGTFDAPFDRVPTAMWASPGAHDVRSITRDANGCRLLTIGRDDKEPLPPFRACVPDEVYPFVEGERLRAISTGDRLASEGLLFANDRGDRLTLLRVAFDAHASSDALRIPFVVEADAHCARVDPKCGHVDVPAKVRAVADAGQTTFTVLAATARPVARPTCVGEGDPFPLQAIAHAWIAEVERALDGGPADGG
jgi:hypothetical protein